MKTTTASMDTHLDLEVTSLTTCWRITRTDGTEFFFTDHDVDVPFGGDIYKASTGYRRTAVQNDASLAVDNLDIEGIFNSAEITEADLRAGLFDYAQIRIFTVNWQDLTDGDVKMRNGRLGEVTLTEQGIFRAELRGLTQALSQRIGELFQPECRADLGDSRCKVPVQPPLRQDSTVYALGDFIRVATGTPSSTQEVYENRIYECTVAGTSAGVEPTFDTVIGNTTVDGTVTFTARDAWTRHGVVDVVTDRKAFSLTGAFDEARAVDGWFNGGALAFETGNNTGKVIEMRDWLQAGRDVTLFIPTAFTIAPGDLVRLYPGCDKRTTICINKFVMAGTKDFTNGNIKNFRGEPFVPGQDELTRYPDAKTG